MKRKLKDLFPQEVWTLIYEFDGSMRRCVHFPPWFFALRVHLDCVHSIRHPPGVDATPAYWDNRNARMMAYLQRRY
jgi:hypothetical protein